MGNFQDKLKIGAMGEQWVKAWLEASGRYVYVPGKVGSHPIDFVVLEASGALWACDVKTYPRRARYPDTGIDANDWEKYAQIASVVPVRLFFVDSFERYCYSVDIRTAALRVHRHGGKVFIPLAIARVEFELTGYQVRQLRERSNSNASYSGTMPYFVYWNSTGHGEK